MKKKIISVLIICLLFFNISNSKAYFSWDIESFIITGNTSRTNILNVPDWLDFLITKVEIHDPHQNHAIYVRDNWWNDLWYFLPDTRNLFEDVNIVIKDSLEVYQEDNTDVDCIYWHYVREDEELSIYINKVSPWVNKNIFTKEDIDFIYFREFIIMSLIWMIKFMSIVLLNRKMPIKFF